MTEEFRLRCDNPVCGDSVVLGKAAGWIVISHIIIITEDSDPDVLSSPHIKHMCSKTCAIQYFMEDSSMEVPEL